MPATALIGRDEAVCHRGIRPRSIPTDTICKVPTKAIDPQPDCFPADNNAPLDQQVLNISRTQR